MRTAAIILVFACLSACHTTRPARQTEPPISSRDTTPAVITADSTPTQPAKTAENGLGKVFKNLIDYQTFTAKVRVQYKGKDGEDDATAFIRMKKDSVMWLSLRGPLGIEGARVIVSQDSVKILNPLKKYVQFRSITYLNEMIGLPLDLKTLQDLVVGNPVFTDSNIISQQATPNNEWVVQMVGKIFKHVVTLDGNEYKMLHSTLEDAEVPGRRTCEIAFSNYDKGTGFFFSTLRKITVTEQTKLDINIDFKQFAFNEAVTFPFNIPKNYKRL